ncbi:MAG: hypothetical protein HRU49_03640 [Winogradskyella sp.]|uniref:hypothetical protein n=1 Tax=Winogradskyella sp. TaxID=1883156 RepID=UPI0025EAEE8A|nr:hypothetical protein [Winogradskyella sp.]NRB82857.1 hypothetical protein [Winogradskyella sp.]
MKTRITILITALFFIVMEAQEKHIETKSVSIENFINFIIEEYPTVTDSIPVRNITFLIQSHGDSFNIEDKVVLKQAFKLLTSRLTAQDTISVISYDKINGQILNWTDGIQSKKLMYAIENPKSSIKFLETDGIELAYKNAKEKFTASSENSVVMIRIPKPKVDVQLRQKESVVVENKAEAKPEKGRNSAVVLTAIALLPEIIKVIKD